MPTGTAMQGEPAGGWVSAVVGEPSSMPSGPTADTTSLEALVEAAEDADAVSDAVALVAAWLNNEATHAGVAAALRASPGPVSALLTRLGARRGMKRHADGVHRLLRRLARQQEVEAREREQADRTAKSPDTRDLRAVLDHDGLPPGLRCPPGWLLGVAGLQAEVVDREGEVREIDVAPRPLVVTARFKNVADGTTSLRIEWPTSTGWTHRVVPRGTAMDSRALVALAAWDAPVHSDNARHLVRFLTEFEAANAEALPEARVSTAMGWQGERLDTFLWGRALIRRGVEARPTAVEDLAPTDLRQGDVYLLADPGVAELAEGFRATGTWEGWLAAVDAARPYPLVWLALYAALVPPLMPFLPTLPNFIVDFAGETSMGKTTTLRFAASAWGCPDERAGGIVRTWDSTRVWIERAAGALGNLPLLLDDTKRARRPEDVGRTLYDLASGSGRGRGSVGGMRDTVRWRTVLLSTGEAPATSFTNDGGTRARTLGLWGSPFGGADERTVAAVRQLTLQVLQHHGHLGPRAVRWLVEAPEARTLVRQRYAEAAVRWTDAADGHPVATRAAQYVAALEVAERIIHRVLGVPAPESAPLDHAWAAVCAAAGEADRASDALREVLSWAGSQQARFWGQPGSGSATNGPPGGWLGAWVPGDHWTQLALLPTELKGFLARQSFDPEAVLKTWAGRGWLRSEGRHRTRKVAVAGRKLRCVVVLRSACDVVSEDGDPETTDA